VTFATELQNLRRTFATGNKRTALCHITINITTKLSAAVMDIMSTTITTTTDTRWAAG
jgi:hypothetical protein